MLLDNGSAALFYFQSNMNHTVIIGAGPAGLAMAGRLRKAGIDFVVLEQQHQIAPSWQNHYRRLHLHTVKRYSNLPHKTFSDQLPQYVPRAKLVEYYEEYARDMGIEPIFNQTVREVKRTDEGWLVSTQDREFLAMNLVVATGFNRHPVRPVWPGEADFGGEIVHSRDYRTANQFKGKRVLVVGFGNTGAEIALDLLEQGAHPSLAVRSPVNIVPRDFMGNATQDSAMILSKLPYAIGDAIGSAFQKLAIGDLSRYGLRKPPYAPSWQQLTTGKTPVMDIGTVAAIKRGDIRVFGGVQKFEPARVHFEDGSSEAFDAIILATGYAAAVEEFVEDGKSLLNTHGIPANLWFETKPSLYFLGFDAYSNGLLWSIREDSGKILKHIQNKSKNTGQQGAEKLSVQRENA